MINAWRSLAAAAVVGLAPTMASAAGRWDRNDRNGHHDDNDVHININIGQRDRVECPPTYDYRTTRIWVEPVYQTVCDRVWVEPVYRTDCDRVWVPDRYESRRVICYEGRRRAERWEQVLVERGHYETRDRRVLVSDGHWQEILRQVVVAPGHWEDRVERVAVYRNDYRDRFEGFNLFARIGR